MSEELKSEKGFCKGKHLLRDGKNIGGKDKKKDCEPRLNEAAVHVSHGYPKLDYKKIGGKQNTN